MQFWKLKGFEKCKTKAIVNSPGIIELAFRTNKGLRPLPSSWAAPSVSQRGKARGRKEERRRGRRSVFLRPPSMRADAIFHLGFLFIWSFYLPSMPIKHLPIKVFLNWRIFYNFRKLCKKQVIKLTKFCTLLQFEQLGLYWTISIEHIAIFSWADFELN